MSEGIGIVKSRGRDLSKLLYCSNRVTFLLVGRSKIKPYLACFRLLCQDEFELPDRIVVLFKFKIDETGLTARIEAAYTSRHENLEHVECIIQPLLLDVKLHKVLHHREIVRVDLKKGLERLYRLASLTLGFKREPDIEINRFEFGLQLYDLAKVNECILGELHLFVAFPEIIIGKRRVRGDGKKRPEGLDCLLIFENPQIGNCKLEISLFLFREKFNAALVMVYRPAILLEA